MSKKEKLAKMLDNLEYPELFETLNKMRFSTPSYNLMKEEFIWGKIDVFFNKRLKVLITILRTNLGINFPPVYQSLINWGIFYQLRTKA